MIHRFLVAHPSYPWLVAAIAMLVVTASNGMSNTGITVFDAALIEEFGWSTGELKIRDAINFLGAACLVFFAGLLVDRIGTKPLLIIGMTTLAVVYYCYPAISNLRDVYLLHGLLAITIACAGNMVAIVTAASWMPQRRGLAVGLAIAGTSVGGMVLPPLFSLLNQSLGWQEALRRLSFIPLAIAVLVFLLVRNTRRSEQVAPADDGIAFKDVLRRSEFWSIGVAAAATYFSILALYAHLFLYLLTLGYSQTEASLGLSAMSVAALCGKLGAGGMADRINPTVLLKICMGVMLVGLVVTTQISNVVYIGLLITGLGWGCLHTLYNYVLLALFGMRAAGKVNGSISVTEAFGGGVGIISAGFLFDRYGSYQVAFLVMLCVMTVGSLLTLLLPNAATRIKRAPS